MQAADLTELTGCTLANLKQWVREGVILPAQPGFGSGIHADYDEANVVATLLAMALRESHVVLRHYAPAFAKFQVELRGQSSLKWGQLRFSITLEDCHFFRGAVQIQESCALVVNVDALSHRLKKKSDPRPWQFDLLRLRAVR